MENLQKGHEYQDFVVDRLLREGIFIGVYSSRKWQMDKGESASGVEIKFDGKWQKTGNLYIEVAEKSNAFNPYYVDSGIMRNDNSWLYLIGDYDSAFLFSIKQLKQILVIESEGCRSARGIRQTQTKTSRGWLIPVNYAMIWLCLRRFDFKGSDTA